MSLISEALKEAQRERTERAGPRATSSITDNFFPYPARGKGAPQNRALLLSGAAAVIVLAAVAMGARWYLHRPTRAATPAASLRISAPTVAPVAASGVASGVAPGVAKPPATAAPSLSIVPPERKPAAAAAQPVVRHETVRSAEQSKPAPIVQRQRAAVDSAPRSIVAPTSSAPPAASPPAASPPAPAVKPQGTSAQGVRIVLDPSGTRPADSLFAQAYAEHSRGNLDMARDLYEKALRKPPVAPELYNNYGALLASLGNHTAAIAMYNLGLKVNDTDARLWTNLAASYNATGRHAEAMSAYAQAAKLDPTNGVVKTRLAAEYIAIGDTSSARRIFEEAAKSSSKDPAVHYAYGSFLQSQRDFKGAIREFQLFVDLGAASYDASTIDKMRKFVASLRQAYP